MISAIMIVALLQCPTADDVERTQRDFYRVPIGCPAPAPGYWFTERGHQKVTAMLAERKQALIENERLLAGARRERDQARVECVTELDKLRAEIARLTSALADAAAKLRASARSLMACADPPRRTTWTLVGTGIGAAVCATGAIVGASLR